MPRRKSTFVALFVLGAVLCVLLLFGPTWIRRIRVQRDLLAAIHLPNRMQQLHAFAEVRDANRDDAVGAALRFCDDSDARIRSGAVSFLILAYPPAGDVDMPDHVSDRLARLLCSDPQAGVRLSCAIGIMSSHTPAVRDAYLAALHDSSDKVVELSCIEVAERGGPRAKQALDALLDRPSWRVRLEACKGLIHGKMADANTVAVLEKMRQEPEAIAYDAETEEFEQMERQSGAKLGETWGKLDSIIAQARQVASANGSPGKRP